MKNIVEFVYKQAEEAADAHWDATLLCMRNNSYDNNQRLQEASAALEEACRIRDDYVKHVIL